MSVPLFDQLLMPILRLARGQFVWAVALPSALALCAGGAGLLSASAAPEVLQDGQTQARRELESARARWKANATPHYRLRVRTRNPLRETLTESDVRDGTVLVARGASGMPGVDQRPGSGAWGPAAGHTVEALFRVIGVTLQSTDSVVSATFHPRRGYPTQIYIRPRAMVMDADVSYDIELMESPAKPLVEPSPGEAYRSPIRARVVSTWDIYNSLFGFGTKDFERLVERVWPTRAAEIIARGASPYWNSVGWKPEVGLIGDIIGTLTHLSGATLYVMEFQHRGATLFLLIERSGVQVIK